MNYTVFKGNSLIGFILKIVGLLVIAYGFINGIVINAEFSREFDEVNFMPLSIFFTPMLIGLLIFGFGEVIDLLQEIADKGKPAPQKNEIPKPTADLDREVPLHAEKEIIEFYSNKEMVIKKIESTKESDIFKVEVDGRIEYVELGGFSPQVLSIQEVRDRTR